MSASKKEAVRELCSLIHQDFKRISPGLPPAEVVVPYANRVLWLLVVLMFAYVTTGIIILK